jgi:hypothetical protein
MFLSCRLIRFIESHYSSSSQNTRSIANNSNINPQQEDEDDDVEFNDKLTRAKQNSIATILPIHICTEITLQQLDVQYNHSIPPKNTAAITATTQQHICPICLEPLLLGEELCLSNNKRHCKHIFHSNCIYNWLIKNDPYFICPMCRCTFI